MAFAFRLKMQKPSWRELLERLQSLFQNDVRISVEKPDRQSNLASPPLLVIYRERISTRGVELLEGDEELILRIPRLASSHDISMGLEILGHAAEELESSVSTVAGEFRRDELFSDRVAGLLAKSSEEEVEAIAASIASGQTVEIAGAVRPFFIGPRLLPALHESDPELPMYDLLIDAIRKVQFAHLRGYQPATVMGLRKRGQDFTASTWAPGHAHLFAPVDELLVKAPGTPLRLPWAQLQAVAREKFRPLDERQVLVDSFTEQEWPEVISRVEALVGTRN